MVAMKHMTITVGLIALFVGWGVGAAGQARAATYVVHQASPAAADTNTGTEEKPFKTVQHADSGVGAGHSIKVHGDPGT